MPFHHHFPPERLAFLARTVVDGWRVDCIELISHRDSFSDISLNGDKGTQWTANFNRSAKVIFRSPSDKWAVSITIRNSDLDPGLGLGYGLLEMDNQFEQYIIEDIHTRVKDYNMVMLRGINLKPSRIEIHNLNYKGPFSQDLTTEEGFLIDQLINGLTDEDIAYIRQGPAYQDADEDDAKIEYQDIDLDFDAFIVIYDDEQQRKLVIQYGSFAMMDINKPYGTFLYPFPRLTFHVRRLFTKEGEA